MMRILLVVCGLCVLGFAGCSNYVNVQKKADDWLEKKQYEKALQFYDEELKDSQRDRLLYLMDKGMVLHLAGRYEESNRLLMEADRLAEELDAISITTQAGAFLSNDETIPYKGEDYEKIMINAYTALNFIGLNDYESALVEVRRMDEKLEVLKQNEGQKYREDAFAYYLAGLLYEATGEANDAYIDYQRTFRLNPDFPYVKEDLLRLSGELGFREDLERWSTEFDLKYQPLSSEEREQGELVVIYSAGKSPRKIPHQKSAHAITIGYVVAGGIGAAAGGDFLVPIPRFRKRAYQLHQLKVWNKNQELASSHEVENLEEIGFQSLEDRLGREVTRAIVRLAAKAKVQDEIRKNFGGIAGLVAGTALILTQRADTRSWLTLPASLQVARTRLNPGEHQITLKFYNKLGTPIGADEQHTVQIRPRQKTFLIVRTMQ